VYSELHINTILNSNSAHPLAHRQHPTCKGLLCSLQRSAEKHQKQDTCLGNYFLNIFTVLFWAHTSISKHKYLLILVKYIARLMSAVSRHC